MANRRVHAIAHDSESVLMTGDYFIHATILPKRGFVCHDAAPYRHAHSVGRHAWVPILEPLYSPTKLTHPQPMADLKPPWPIASSEQSNSPILNMSMPRVLGISALARMISIWLNTEESHTWWTMILTTFDSERVFIVLNKRERE